MAFSQASITSGPLFYPDGPHLLVVWTSSAPAGTWFQVYVDHRLVAATKARSLSIPNPRGPAQIDIGTVAAGEEALDFTASLPAPAGTGGRARLTWQGGNYLGPAGVIGFRVYMGATAGGAVDYGTVAAFVPAYTGNLTTDGFGMGGFGAGGFGSSAASYEWISPLLDSGTWNFAVKSLDAAGNEGSAATFAVAITTPPRPPAAPASGGPRVTYTYSASTHKATLSWLASPLQQPPLTPP